MTLRLTDAETTTYFTNLKVPFASRFISVDGHRLHYVETGKSDSTTLFFVHGSPGSWDAFQSYLSDSLLLSKYRMIAVDRPGFGYSEFGQAEELKTQSRLLEHLINTIDNGKPIILVGHSLGGPVIVKMATEQPEKFQNLVILAGSVDPSAESKELWRVPFIAKPLRYLVPGALRPSNDELWSLKSSLLVMKPELKKIVAHVTVIHGTNDPLVPYSNVAFIEKEFAGAKSMRVIAIKNANHFIPWEHFELIRNTLFSLNVK